MAAGKDHTLLRERFSNLLNSSEQPWSKDKQNCRNSNALSYKRVIRNRRRKKGTTKYLESIEKVVNWTDLSTTRAKIESNNCPCFPDETRATKYWGWQFKNIYEERKICELTKNYLKTRTVKYSSRGK